MVTFVLLWLHFIAMVSGGPQRSGSRNSFVSVTDVSEEDDSDLDLENI